jgi:hypothetical protein
VAAELDSITSVEPSSCARVGDPGELDVAEIKLMVTGAAETATHTAGPELTALTAHVCAAAPFTE